MPIRESVSEAQRMGFYTESRLDLGTPYPVAATMLMALLEERDSYIDDDGYRWSVVGSLLDEAHSRLAWVEWRRRERGTHEDHAYFLKARNAAGRLRVWDIETDHPYFGCTVRSLAWQEDDVVLVYTDKHAVWEARIGTAGPVCRRKVQVSETASVACQLIPADIHAVYADLYHPAWGARHWGRYEGVRRVLASVALNTFVVLLLKLFTRNKLGTDIVGWDVVAGAVLGGAALGVWWARQNTSVPPAESTIYRPFTLSIDSAGFRVRGEGFDSQTGWGQVTSLRRAGSYLLIETGLGGAHLVPVRDFPSSKSADMFLAEMERYAKEASKDGTNEPPRD